MFFFLFYWFVPVRGGFMRFTRFIGSGANPCFLGVTQNELLRVPPSSIHPRTANKEVISKTQQAGSRVVKTNGS